MLRIQFKWGQKIESCPLCAAATAREKLWRWKITITRRSSTAGKIFSNFSRFLSPARCFLIINGTLILRIESYCLFLPWHLTFPSLSSDVSRNSFNLLLFEISLWQKRNFCIAFVSPKKKNRQKRRMSSRQDGNLRPCDNTCRQE